MGGGTGYRAGESGVNPYALRLTPIIDDVHHHVGEPAQRIIEEFLNQ